MPPSPLFYVKAFLLFTKADNPWEPSSSSRPFLGIIFSRQSIIMYNSTALCGFCCKKDTLLHNFGGFYLYLDPWKKNMGIPMFVSNYKVSHYVGYVGM